MAKKIMLDAGHYGKYNRSPHVPDYWESQRMWVLMRFLQAQLEKRGYIVYTTRDEQAKDLAVKDRGAKSKGYDLFISLHSNDFDGSENIEKAEKVDYVVAYVPSYANNDRCKNSKKLGLKFAEYVKGLIGSQQYARTDTNLNANGDEYYGVLRGWQRGNCPVGFIIEHGFHSNPKTAKWLLDDENLLKLAIGEADLIDKYFKGEFDEKQTTTTTTTTSTPASTTTSTSGEIKVGSIVKIKDGAKLYNSLKKFGSWVYPIEWVVLQISGKKVIVDKSVDGKHSIESPVHIDNLILVGSQIKEEPKAEIKVGSVVRIKDGAYMYGTARKLSSWVYPLNWVVLQIKEDKVIVDKSEDGKHSIETPVNIKDLTLIK